MRKDGRLEVKGYFEDYRCGCVSKTVKRKKDLLGYCATHGDDRRHVWPDVEFPKEQTDES